jgi:D-beta-D-heptose 7-phosphate kinase/D-beta-D-heptose 1-phosphate adenosyltransferase
MAPRGLHRRLHQCCFDILHPGHLSLLGQAKQHCDRLVVGLNSDASVKRLKGQTRPLQGEPARASIIGALDPVDLVVIFEEDTPYELISKLKPNVIVKGADYSEDQIVGAELVKAAGGKVVRAEMIEGLSTTQLIARSQMSK